MWANAVLIINGNIEITPIIIIIIIIIIVIIEMIIMIMIIIIITLYDMICGFGISHELSSNKFNSISTSLSA